MAGPYEPDRYSGTVQPNKGQSQTSLTQHPAEVILLLAGFMQALLPDTALGHGNVSAGCPWRDAALSCMDKYRISHKAGNILGQLHCGFICF